MVPQLKLKTDLSSKINATNQIQARRAKKIPQKSNQRTKHTKPKRTAPIRDNNKIFYTQKLL